MRVLVEIDLTKDVKLMALSQTDPRLIAMLDTYNAMDDDARSETYLEYIGLYLWGKATFKGSIAEHCEVKRFHGQTKAFLFAFETDDASACLFRLACHAPVAVSIKMVAGEGIEPPTISV